MGAEIAIATIVDTLALCGVIAGVILGRVKKEAYAGVITSKHKEEHEDAQDSSYTSSYLMIKLNGGEKKRVTRGKKLWNQFSVAIRLSKR